jgi:hypothetical protein
MWSSVPDAATRIPDDVQRPLVVAGVHVDLEDPDLVGLGDLGPRGSASTSCLRASWSRGVPRCTMSIATT